MALVLIPEGGLHPSRRVRLHVSFLYTKDEATAIIHKDYQPSRKSLQFDRHSALAPQN